MKRLFSSLFVICFLLVIYSLLVSGCNQDFSRYPSVSIPQYTEVDYFNLLSNENPEIVYNAVVVLGQQAAAIGEKLSDEKINKETDEYITALNTYKKVVTLLNARDPRVVAASLRFLQLFSDKYKSKTDLIEPVLKIKSNNPQVLYEKIITLSLLVNRDSNIPDETLHKFLNDPSWIVSRSAILLVNSLQSDRIRQELFDVYKGLTDEKEKLLILMAFEKQLSDSLTDAFLKEVFTTKSIKIKNAIYDIVSHSQNQEKVLLWLDQNYERIDQPDKEYLFALHSATIDEKFSSQLVSLLFKKGFPADASFLTILNEELDIYEGKKEMSDGDKEKFNNLLELKKALLTNKSLSEQWVALEEKNRAMNMELTELQNEYDAITKKYANQIERLFSHYRIPNAQKQKYIAGILKSRDDLKELLMSDKDAGK